MIGLGISDGDLLVVDRAAEHKHNSIAIVCVAGELTCKQLDIKNQRLKAAHKNYPDIPITGDLDIVIEGIVIWVIKDASKV